MDYWSERRLNHHAAGIEAMGLSLYGDGAHRMSDVSGILIALGCDEERVRRRLREDFSIEIGSFFGKLQDRIWPDRDDGGQRDAPRRADDAGGP